MADIKISALPAGTTPAGTEEVPLVQGGITKKVTVSQILAGTPADKVTSVDTRTGEVTLSDRYVSVTGGTVTGPLKAPYIGLGTGWSADRFVNISGQLTGTGATQYGLASTPTFKMTTTTRGYAAFFRCDTEAAVFNVPGMRNLYVASPIIGAGSTIGTMYGLEIEALTVAGVTTGYGIYQRGATDINVFAGPINGTTTGLKVASTATEKLGFYGATPVVRPTGTPAAATDPATTMALVNDLRAKLIALGLIS